MGAALLEDQEAYKGCGMAILLIGNRVLLAKGFTVPQYWFPTSVTFTLRGPLNSSPSPLTKSSTV